MNAWIARLNAAAMAGIAASPAAAGFYNEGMWHHSWGWGHTILGGLMMVLFWGAIVTLFVLLGRWLWRTTGQPQSLGTSAQDILEERFARGEIDREEFEERAQVLAQRREAERARRGRRA